MACIASGYLTVSTIYDHSSGKNSYSSIKNEVYRDEHIEVSESISLPAELTNKYALSNAKTKWYFRCVVQSSGSNGGNSSSNIIDWLKGDNTSSIEIERSPETSSIQKSVDVDLSGTNKKHIKTGDDSQLGLYIASTLFFGLLAIILILVDKKRKKDEDK